MIPKNNLIYNTQVHRAIPDIILFYRLIQNGINIEFFREVDKNKKFSKTIFLNSEKMGCGSFGLVFIKSRGSEFVSGKEKGRLFSLMASSESLRIAIKLRRTRVVSVKTIDVEIDFVGNIFVKSTPNFFV